MSRSGSGPRIACRGTHTPLRHISVFDIYARARHRACVVNGPDRIAPFAAELAK